ncbi:ribose 5-phosphate isomerase A [Filimonas zeae]|nr:ribose 5-phosphate isomerase A [Filimonas zeae]MDR6339784.1 ribose 5-phosphate isomerase A [Filimonas zeae]
MKDLKKVAAVAAVEWLEKGMTVGLGAGKTIAYLIEIIEEQQELAHSLTFLSASSVTTDLLLQKQLTMGNAREYERVDVYFDSCDQLDHQLNAWKSGGGIHTDEKMLAAMADDFILLADAGKLMPVLTPDYPLVLEVIPEAARKVMAVIQKQFPGAAVGFREELQQPVTTHRNNYLVEVRFNTLPYLQELNLLKMLPGVLEHSLFYRMASKAIVAGYSGTDILFAPRS